MALEDVLKVVGNNSELAEELRGVYEANGENVKRIGYLETKINEAVEKKDKVVGLVRNNLGITEISEETMKRFAENGDEAIKKDNEALRMKLEETQTNLLDAEQGYKKREDTMVLKDTLRGLGIADRAVNEVAFEELTNIILDEANREGSQFTFKDEEGRTRFTDAGKPMTVEDRVNEIATGDRAFLFNPRTGASTPANSRSEQSAPPVGVASYITDTYL